MKTPAALTPPEQSSVNSLSPSSARVKQKKNKDENNENKEQTKEKPKPKYGCNFDEFGCTFKGGPNAVNDHLSKEPVHHGMFLRDAVSLMKLQTYGLSEHLNKMVDDFDELYVRHDRLVKRYGSHLLWKINNYSEKLDKAKNGGGAIIFSPPFYTGRHGYKLVASAALNGDGKGAGKFMSVFVAVVRGEFDSIVGWPFSHSITFTLLDQSENVYERKHIKATVKPNAVKENYVFLVPTAWGKMEGVDSLKFISGRPRKERNPSFGCQTFAALSAIKTFNYVQDDTLFIRIEMDEKNVDIL